MRKGDLWCKVSKYLQAWDVFLDNAVATWNEAETATENEKPMQSLDDKLW